MPVASVSTHSRPKAAGSPRAVTQLRSLAFQHTAARRRLAYSSLSISSIGWFQHTAARRRLASTQKPVTDDSCFNTQPPEGGWVGSEKVVLNFPVSTHSRPKAAGINFQCLLFVWPLFQHTAARRRLVSYGESSCINELGFNTQPPEGGWNIPCR